MFENWCHAPLLFSKIHTVVQLSIYLVSITIHTVAAVVSAILSFITTSEIDRDCVLTMKYQFCKLCSLFMAIGLV